MRKIRTEVSLIFLASFVLLASSSFANAEEISKISIDFIGDPVLELDSNQRMIRANILIENYNHKDGYYFMKVNHISTNETIKDTEIIPKHIDENLWGVQISHYVAPDVEEESIVGNYELQVYSEFGSAIGNEFFKIIKSGQDASFVQSAEIVNFQNENLLDNENTVTEENLSQIPGWVHTIFVWYAEKSISEKDLIQALQFLIDEKIIVVNQ